jgi:hypothetical protein
MSSILELIRLKAVSPIVRLDTRTETVNDSLKNSNMMSYKKPKIIFIRSELIKMRKNTNAYENVIFNMFESASATFPLP